VEWKKLQLRPPFVAALAAAGLLGAWLLLRGGGPAASTASAGGRPSGRGRGAEDVPRIGLARLASPPPSNRAGQRNLFEFGPEPPDPSERILRATPPPPAPAPMLTPPPVATPPPNRAANINLKYIGSLEGQGGVKVAVLLTDRNEILYGEVGQQVANRFKIVRIGFESVEVVDGGSGQSRRIPLRAN
jgi:hypothetical protein